MTLPISKPKDFLLKDVTIDLNRLFDLLGLVLSLAFLGWLVFYVQVEPSSGKEHSRQTIDKHLS